jgi:hypothetical protein
VKLFCESKKKKGKKKKEKKKEKEKRHVQLLWKSFPQQLYYTKYIQLLCKTITLYFIIELKKKKILIHICHDVSDTLFEWISFNIMSMALKEI